MSGIKPSARSRSPRYPSSDLGECLSYINLLYEAVHRSSVDSETAYKLIGFTGKSGTSARALGSVRQFGLIDGVGENTRVSDLALAILEPESSDEYKKRLSDALITPDVFTDILEKFEDRIPNADEPIRAFLIRELGFQKNSADECIKCMRDSYAYLKAEIARNSVANADESRAIVPALIVPPAQLSSEIKAEETQAIAPVEATHFATMPLSKECQAELKIFGPLTTNAVANLIKHVELLAEVWRSD